MRVPCNVSIMTSEPRLEIHILARPFEHQFSNAFNLEQVNALLEDRKAILLEKRALQAKIHDLMWAGAVTPSRCPLASANSARSRPASFDTSCWRQQACVYIYIYMYMYICIYIYMYIYVFGCIYLYLVQRGDVHICRCCIPFARFAGGTGSATPACFIPLIVSDRCRAKRGGAPQRFEGLLFESQSENLAFMHSVDSTCRRRCCSGVHARLREASIAPGLPPFPCFPSPSPRESPKRVLVITEERGICRISDIEFLWRCAHSCGDSSRAIPAPLPHPILSGGSPLFQHGVSDSSTHAVLRVVLGTGA